VGDESVPPAVHRADAALQPAVVSDGLSSCLDAARQRGLRDEAITPDLVEQLVLGHDAVAVLQQIHENVENLRLELDHLARPIHLEQVCVELAVLEPVPHRQGVCHRA
jgi:hypothetical protein